MDNRYIKFEFNGIKSLYAKTILRESGSSTSVELVCIYISYSKSFNYFILLLPTAIKLIYFTIIWTLLVYYISNTLIQ